MTQYLNIDEFFEEGERLEAEGKAKEAIDFATWLLQDYGVLENEDELCWTSITAPHIKCTTEELYKIFKSQQ